MQRDLEQERLSALNKARRTISQQNKPLDIQRTQVEEQLGFYSEKLLIAAEGKNTDEALALVQKVVELKAQQVAIDLQEKQIAEVVLTDDDVKEIAQAYEDECYKLALAVDHLLGITHDL